MGFTYLLTHILIRMKITLLKAFVFLLFVFLHQNGLAAQNRTLKGTITDADDNSPMIGVTVLVVGTGIGTVTDLDGTYAIQVATGQTLRYSYTGYKPKEIKITNETLLDVQLIAEATALGEIVVTALGIKEEKKKLAYSIQEVKGEALQNTGRDNFIVSLQGRVAGLNMTPTSGQAGSSVAVQLRGPSSIDGNNQPLFVVDRKSVV